MDESPVLKFVEMFAIVAFFFVSKTGEDDQIAIDPEIDRFEFIRPTGLLANNKY